MQVRRRWRGRGAGGEEAAAPGEGGGVGGSPLAAPRLAALVALEAVEDLLLDGSHPLVAVLGATSLGGL